MLNNSTIRTLSRVDGVVSVKSRYNQSLEIEVENTSLAEVLDAVFEDTIDQVALSFRPVSGLPSDNFSPQLDQALSIITDLPGVSSTGLDAKNLNVYTETSDALPYLDNLLEDTIYSHSVSFSELGIIRPGG